MERRNFLKYMAFGAAGLHMPVPGRKEGVESLKSTSIVFSQDQNPMTYRKLGRTNFMSSRLVFGGGAALAGGKAVRLLDRALEAGINHFDLGSNVYYRGAERSFAPFLKKNRDKIWVVSKAPVMIRAKPEESINLEQAQAAAKSWTKLLEASLKDLDTDHVDAYYIMAADNPTLISREEMYNAFLQAKKAGKVDFFGLSTHKNAQKLLEIAIETNWYDIAMIGITPAGWYDWDNHDLLAGTPALEELEGLLKRARAAGIGLVGMKTVRHLAPKSSFGKGDASAFDKFYPEKLLKSSFSPFQRAYAYVLEHGLDVVNADMQNFKHLEENIIAVAKAKNNSG